MQGCQPEDLSSTAGSLQAGHKTIAPLRYCPFEHIAAYQGWSTADLPPAGVVSEFSHTYGVPLDTLMHFCSGYDPAVAQCYLETFRTDLRGVDAMHALSEHAARPAAPDAISMAVDEVDKALAPPPAVDGADRQGP